MSWAVRSLVGSLVVTCAAVGIGVALHSPAPALPQTLGAPLASVDTTTIAVARAPFCDRVPAADLAAALGSTPAAPEATAPGSPSSVRHQIADEDGCTWTAGSAEAAAWIFAPPVTPAWARQLATVPHGCTSLTGAAYGSPSAAYTCGGTTTLKGLFGDAWLTCTLSSTDTAPSLDQVGRWCIAVARAAAAS